MIYDLFEYNIPGDITGRIEPKLNLILSIPGIRGYRRYFTYLHRFALKGYVNKIITSISDDIVYDYLVDVDDNRFSFINIWNFQLELEII